MLRKLSAILMTLCLTVGAMTPLAHAAGGLRLVTSSQEAASQEVGFSGVSSNCQSFQATFNLSNSTAIYDFMANDVLDALSIPPTSRRAAPSPSMSPPSPVC